MGLAGCTCFGARGAGSSGALGSVGLTSAPAVRALAGGFVSGELGGLDVRTRPRTMIDD